jgi:putative PIN family toxin of toxin-antitoxin system
MTRVVADTNIYVSALMFAGLPGALLNLGLLQALTLVISPPLLDELEDKLRVKFGVTAKDAATIRAKLQGTADVVTPAFVLDVVKDDPDDNRVLECALAGKADYIVSGDRHLLKLKAHAGIPILTARQFLDAVALPS